MRRKLFSAESLSIALGLFLLRAGISALMLTHGWPKLLSFSDKSSTFSDPYGLGSTVSMAMAIFAEVFCSIFIFVGFATRIAVIPLIITMLTAVFIIHADDPFGRKELGLLYLIPFATLFFTGPGKYSIDAVLRRGK